MLKKPKVVASIFGIISLIIISLYSVTENYKHFRKISNAFVIDCTIFDSKMIPLIHNSSNLCHFFKSGEVAEFIVEDGQGFIILLDENGIQKWKRPYIVHHIMRASHDEKTLYFLSLEKKFIRGVEAKFDKIIALDISTGNELSSWNVFDYTDQLEAEIKKYPPLRICLPYRLMNKDKGEINNEYTHFNSINLITNESKEFAKDDLIVNSGRGFVIFFDRDLKPIRQLFWINLMWDVNVHDVQLTKDGNLLMYKNWDFNERFSSLEIVSLKNNEKLWKYNKDPEGREFKAEGFGSVQLLDDGSFLYSDMEKGGHFTIVGKDGKMIIDYYHPERDPETNKPQRFHSVRMVKYEDLSDEVQILIDKNPDTFLFKHYFKLLKIAHHFLFYLFRFYKTFPFSS
ncbi:MAG: hypothetical protein H7281_16500 [Bacteriovorax sp.]|nr:hypothetical protein [Bacteriovorax sp.]